MTIFFVVALGGVLLVLQPFPILHDYPEWMYQGHIVWALFFDTDLFASYFELMPVPVPNAISQVAIALLNIFVTPVMAGKIWLAVYLMLALSVAIIGTRRHQLRGAKQVIFLITIAFGPGFFNGYINFQYGVLFFALFVITDSQRSIVRLVLFSLLIYFSHASVFAGFAIFVVLTELFGQRRIPAFFALLPTLILLLWYSMVKLISDTGFNVSVDSLKQWIQYKAYTLAKQGPFHNFIQPDGQSLLTDLHGIYLLGFVLNFIIALLIGYWLLSLGYALLKRREILIHSDSRLAALIITAVVLFILYLLAGSNTFGVVNLGERFLITALMLLLLLTRMPRWQVAAWSVVCAASGVVTLVSLFVLSQTIDSYSVDRSADSKELSNFVGDIYSNSRHNYFNHRLFIYANLGQYLLNSDQFDEPPPIDHQSSIVRLRDDNKSHE